MVNISRAKEAHRTYQLNLPLKLHLKRGPITMLPQAKVARRLLARTEEAMNHQLGYLLQLHKSSYSNSRLSALTFQVSTSILRIYRSSGFSPTPDFRPNEGARIKRPPTREELAQVGKLSDNLLKHFPRATNAANYLSTEEQNLFFAHYHIEYISALGKLYSLSTSGQIQEFERTMAKLKCEYDAACEGAPTKPYALRLYGNLAYDRIAPSTQQTEPKVDSGSYQIV